MLRKILVVRNDKIGDFVLAWPTLAMLKASLPDVRIGVLVPAYTAPLADLCAWVDDVFIDPTAAGESPEQERLLERKRGFCATPPGRRMVSKRSLLGDLAAWREIPSRLWHCACGRLGREEKDR